MRSNTLCQLSVAALLTFTLLESTSAQALTTWRVFAPSMCVAESGSVPYTNGYGQAENSSAGSNAQWVCPVVSDSTMQARNSTKAQTWGYVNNGCFGATVSVKLCRTYYTGSGGACGATNTPPSLNSNFTLQMTPGTEWTGAAYPDSYYFYVTVGAGCSGVSNIVFGYDYET